LPRTFRAGEKNRVAKRTGMTERRRDPPAEAERLAYKWNDSECAGLSEEELLVYRSRLLGSDLRVTNYGGGNTSAKLTASDPLTGEAVEVLWVKGSGGDLGSITLDGFATLYVSKLLELEKRYRGIEHEDEMADALRHCAFGSNPRATSIDTPPHGFIPHRHVDHVHADAIIALAAARHGERLTRAVFGDEIGWIAWQRPGFDLGLVAGRKAEEGGARLQGLVLGSHGLLSWGETSRDCYRNTLGAIQKAADWLSEHARPQPFGPEEAAPLPERERQALLCAIAPEVRGLLGAESPKVMHYVDAAGVLEFVGASRCAELAGRGTTCPDHFLRTRVRPLFVPFEPGRETASDLLARLPSLVEAYRREYAAYYDRCKRPDSPAMRDPSPVILLVPGLGLLSFQKDKHTARVAAQYYQSTINVMRWAEGVDEYAPISEQEAFDIEYWRLEEAKLERLPKSKPLAGKVALVTGGAGGIGSAAARRLLDEDACVVVVDVDRRALETAAEELAAAHGRDRVRAFPCDVTDEASVAASFESAVREFGGLDVLVSNAGIASAAPVDETTLEAWQKNMDVLATGYFLVSREAFRLMKRQGRGGSIVFVGSKNALAASAGAAAYGSAKAAAVHLARNLALEGAAHGIRVNVVNPDAVIRGSRIWSGPWRAERAAGNRIAEEEVEEFYRQRSLLKRSVFPEDVAEAILFFASESSSKCTGNVLNVDAGHPAAFPR
jgi:rhamnulose-1-phosphate aldolase/alcohol dehydrogenase